MLVGDVSQLGSEPVEPLVGFFERVPAGELPKRLVHEPQGFRVTGGSGMRVEVHYHPVDQFQIFVAGDGRLGRHGVRSESLHYTDAFQPYGPLVAGEAGFAYMTLRGWSDRGAWFMPASRDDLATSRADRSAYRPRNLTVDLAEVSSPGAWAWVLDEADGLRVGVYQADTPGSLDLPAAGGDGAYVVVLRGALTVAAAELAPSSVVFVFPGEAPDPGQATAGTKVCWLQLPVADRTLATA